MVQIKEIFLSLQGEGARTGRPSVFVRTGLCNFSCKGFGVEYQVEVDGVQETRTGCDSWYSVDPAFKNTWKAYTEYSNLVLDILSEMKEYSKYNLLKPDIVFTGGEPLIYWNDEVFQRTLAFFVSRGHHVTIETNAALDINFTREYQRKIQFSQSVKLQCSGEEYHKRINIETLTKIAESTNNSYLKFVTSEKTFPEDEKEMDDILKRIPIYVDVWLMPMGETQEEMEINQLFVAEKAIEKGYSYAHRVHIALWSDKPGV